MALDEPFVCLLTELLKGFSGPDNDYPRLSPERIACARSLLKSLVVDYDTLEGYMELVAGSLAGATPPPDIGYEKQCFAVIEQGVEDITAEALAKLLLDPVGVMNIHLAVEATTPSDWEKDLAANGRELRKQYGLTSDLPQPNAQGNPTTLQYS